MTPISRFLLRILPRPAAVGALALVYAAMMAAIVVAGDVEREDIIYVDVRDQ